MTLTYTFTQTYTVTIFADPYKVCCECGEHICGVLDVDGPLTMDPCGHQSSYRDTCPSWGPVDGCRCSDFIGAVPHEPAPVCPNHRLNEEG